jgi:hypothetical protein
MTRGEWEYPVPATKRKRKQFEPRWIKIPRHWVTSLRRTKSAKTYELALIILWQDFKCQHVGGEIILSTEVTDMERHTKLRAAKELEDLGLIKITSNGKQALKVTPH